MTRVCKKCLVEKPIDHFTIRVDNRKSADKQYRRHECRACQKTYNDEWYMRNRERMKLVHKKWADAHQESILKRSRDWYKANTARAKERMRRNKLKQMCGLTLEEYQVHYLEQGGKCKICGSHHRKLVVDHCHKTRKFRGLLCTGCNLALGGFLDNPDTCEKAAGYLRCQKP